MKCIRGTHTLVIADHNAAFTPNVQPVVRYTGSDSTLDADSLTRWTSVAQVASARVALRSPDHRTLDARPVEADVGTDGNPVPMPELVVDDVPGAYAYEDLDQGDRLASRQAEALAAIRSRALARGPWRRAQAGSAFTLVDHPRHDGLDPASDTFVVLAAQHRARNNFSADEKARFVSLTQAILRDQGVGAKPIGATRGDDDAPLHEAALLVQPLAVAVRFGSSDPKADAAPADGRHGVLGRNTDRVVDPAPELFDSRASAAYGQPDVRLNVRPTIHGSQTAIVVGNGNGNGDRDVQIERVWSSASLRRFKRILAPSRRSTDS